MGFKPREWTPMQDTLVRKLWGEGLFVRDIAWRLSIPRSSLTERIHVLQLPIRPVARMPGAWSPEKDRRLCDLWAEGLSTAEIGRQMGGLTKNAIIGRSHRLKLPSRQNPSKSPNPSKRSLRSFAAKAPKRQSTSQQPLSGPTLPQLESARAPVLAYPIARVAFTPRIAFSAGAARTCQWIEGQAAGADTQFCGAKSAPGCSWCPEHRQRVAA